MRNILLLLILTSTAFSPPGEMASEDWVLVLDDAAANYPPPGVAKK